MRLSSSEPSNLEMLEVVQECAVIICLQVKVLMLCGDADELSL